MNNHYPLKKIYNELNYDNCFYVQRVMFPSNIDDPTIEIEAKEILEITNKNEQYIERLIIGYFGDDSTHIMYTGENRQAMLETLKKLKLPKMSSNVGETVLKIFRDNLEGNSEVGTPITLVQKIFEGKEHQLKYVLKKIIEVSN